MAQSASSSPAGSPTALPQSKRQGKARPALLVPIGLVALAGIGAGIWYFLSRPSDHSLHLSGRIEGYETDIGAKTAGRVDLISVREGDAVKTGQLLVRINDDDIQAQLRGAIANVAAAKDDARRAQIQVDVVESQIREAQLNVVQSRQDTLGRVYQAESNVASLEAQLKQAKSELSLAKINRDRYAQLVNDGAVTKQQYDQQQTTYETALATVESVQKQIDAAQGALALAQSSTLNPGIRNAQLAAQLQQRTQAQAQLSAAIAKVKNAIAAENQIRAQISYLNVVSPINGVVTARSVEPGAVVTTGKTLLTLINLNTVYLRGYVPEGDIGRVRVGQSAKVYLDSDPKRPLDAKVAAIDTQASFTPENIYFKQDRVKQVFGVKLILNQPDGFAKPGMPADGEILVDQESHS